MKANGPKLAWYRRILHQTRSSTYARRIVERIVIVKIWGNLQVGIAALNRHGGGEVSQKYMSQIMISQHRMLVGQSWLENNSWRGSLGFVIITSVAPSSRLCCGDEAAIQFRSQKIDTLPECFRLFAWPVFGYQ